MHSVATCLPGGERIVASLIARPAAVRSPGVARRCGRAMGYPAIPWDVLNAGLAQLPPGSGAARGLFRKVSTNSVRRGSFAESTRS